MSKNIFEKEKYILYHKNNIAVNTQFQMSSEREKNGRNFQFDIFQNQSSIFQTRKNSSAKKRKFRKVNFIY